MSRAQRMSAFEGVGGRDVVLGRDVFPQGFLQAYL